MQNQFPMKRVSDEARVVERIWLDDSGDLIMEATLHDPKYYARPVVRRVQMKRSDDQDMIYSPCDPDSFYRSLQLDDALESYYGSGKKIIIIFSFLMPKT